MSTGWFIVGTTNEEATRSYARWRLPLSGSESALPSRYVMAGGELPDAVLAEEQLPDERELARQVVPVGNAGRIRYRLTLQAPRVAVAVG